MFWEKLIITLVVIGLLTFTGLGLEKLSRHEMARRQTEIHIQYQGKHYRCDLIPEEDEVGVINFDDEGE